MKELLTGTPFYRLVVFTVAASQLRPFLSFLIVLDAFVAPASLRLVVVVVAVVVVHCSSSHRRV